MKKILLFLFLFVVLHQTSTIIYAGSPDGGGVWADGIVSSNQQLRKNGTPVVSERSNPQSTVGPAENNTISGNFFSLGFGGSITLKFDNPISNGVVVVEATSTDWWYPNETALVQLSSDGTNWITAGSVSQDGEVAMPERLTCARYARIIDTSNPANFSDETADGYDVDGVAATEGIPCDLPPVPEFGLLTGATALVSSVGVFLKIKGVI